MAGLSCNITYYKESNQKESDFGKQLPLMSEKGGNNSPCIMGLCHGLGCVGWQHRILQKRCAHGQSDMKQLMAKLMECLTPNEMDLF